MARKPSVNGDNLTRLTKPDSLSERIYGDLRGRLQRCEIGPEDRLVDTEIAIAYGTSRMPVREALLRLANEGYLVGTTRGFTVPRLSLDDIREIFEVRRLLPGVFLGSAGYHSSEGVTGGGGCFILVGPFNPPAGVDDPDLELLP